MSVPPRRDDQTVVLLVENHQPTSAALTESLTARGYHVIAATTAAEGLRAAIADKPHLVVLDLALPDVDGETLLQMLRSSSDVPVIVLSSFADEHHVVRALDHGADDYVVTSSGLDQVAARAHALLRRLSLGTDVLVVGGLRIVPRDERALLDDRPLPLTRLEFQLLHLLAVNQARVVDRRTLLTGVWGTPDAGSDQALDVHISSLRRKLGEHGRHYLHTVRGVGFKLTAP
ncbi:response regulator transcription factor [Lentzea sp. NPDC058436]|uniref:response regulator transcription factor n=1 Tax=Lentzea sp. NPDC058436 TaxID=3346499 RepID=UPI00364652E8